VRWLTVFFLMILMSCTTDTLTASGQGQFYRVKKEDTLFSISKRSRTPLRSIIDRNHLRAPYKIKVGQLLFIPAAPVHVVRRGDTLYSVSRKHGVDMNTLANLNNVKQPYTLSLGQKLFLPGAVGVGEDEVKKTDKSRSSTLQPEKKPQKRVSKKSPIVLPKTPSRSGRFLWPVKGKVISNFGSSGGGRHNDGINIKASKGTIVKATENGVVAYAGNEIKGFGNLLLIKHSDGWVSAYAHTDKITVKRGQTVKKGQEIARVGSTGNVKDAQLHFELRKGTKAVNPREYLKD